MRRHLLVATMLVAALLAVMPEQSAAQRAVGGRFSISPGAEFLLPITTTFKDFYNIGFGGSLRGEYAVTPDLSVMLTAGYISLSAKEILGVTPDAGHMIPVVLGLKYYLMPGDLRFYAAFDLGMTSFSQSVSVGGVNLGTASSTEFTWEPQLGFVGRFAPTMLFDLGVRWIGISDANALGVRFGVIFEFGS